VINGSLANEKMTIADNFHSARSYHRRSVERKPERSLTCVEVPTKLYSSLFASNTS